MALWPGEVLSPLSDPSPLLRAAAINSFNFTAWGQDNSFSWVFASAARAGVLPDVTLRHWRSELAAHAQTNRLVAFGGLCSDSLGAVAFIHDMLVQVRRVGPRLVPCPSYPPRDSAGTRGVSAPLSGVARQRVGIVHQPAHARGAACLGGLRRAVRVGGSGGWPHRGDSQRDGVSRGDCGSTSAEPVACCKPLAGRRVRSAAGGGCQCKRGSVPSGSRSGTLLPAADPACSSRMVGAARSIRWAPCCLECNCRAHIRAAAIVVCRPGCANAGECKRRVY